MATNCIYGDPPGDFFMEGPKVELNADIEITQEMIDNGDATVLEFDDGSTLTVLGW